MKNIDELIKFCEEKSSQLTRTTEAWLDGDENYNVTMLDEIAAVLKDYKYIKESKCVE